MKEDTASQGEMMLAFETNCKGFVVKKEGKWKGACFYVLFSATVLLKF